VTRSRCALILDLRRPDHDLIRARNLRGGNNGKKPG